MAERIALLGAAVGPWIDLSELTQPLLKVAGLPEGGMLTIVLRDPDKEVIVNLNGEHPVPEAGWARIMCQISGRHMTVCTFISRKAA